MLRFFSYRDALIDALDSVFPSLVYTILDEEYFLN